MKPETQKPLIAGIMLMVAGFISIPNILYAVIVSAATLSILPMVGDALAGIIIVCGALGVIFGLLSIIGGWFAIKRQKFNIALVGAIFGLLTMGPYCLCSILALVGLIILVISKDEFHD
jgi:hypothetical protein